MCAHQALQAQLWDQAWKSGIESLSADEHELETSCEDSTGGAGELPAGEGSSGSGSGSPSSSSNSSSEDDSDTEESDTGRSDEEQEKKESQPVCSESGGEDCLPHCEHCRKENVQREQVTPRRLSGEQYLMKLDAEGTYECSVTGLIFDVTKAVTINYSLLSWSKYAGLVEPPWVVGGPLFDVRCEAPSALTSIAFPHSLCLGDGGSHPAFKVLHIKGAGAAIEPSMDFSASHVRWLVSSLSPVGPLIRSEEPLLYHGAVVLYKAIDDDPSLLFRVYVATNNDSFIKDISRAVKHSKKKFIKIDKPPVCQKLLQNGKRYRLICEPEAEINPEEIEFVDGSLLKLKSYIEVYFEKPDDFTLSLVELDSDAVVWKAKLRESDWIHYDQNKNEQTRIPSSVKRRKSTNSFSEEEKHCNKKQRSNNYTDGIKTRSLLTDQQLMVIAKLFGVEWKEIAIECLQMEMKDIQQIQANEEVVNIQKFLMLSKWREREQSNGTAQALCNRLREKVSYEIVQALEGFLAE
ncbi:NACHT, LRR and PYD domains-containing protein 1a allele 5 isoform X8 [Gallus gallus]|uniref:NACHT, LRR and PYD domains-containing protein 1a allele 5 isoform X8 n=1 Tax=Gallus gallus TaxID=9031 RepID=UPI001AE7E2C8|nr:NACHT, LRR and PYD domains-containing protein 1a allele 5 isoform X8 [Gallus gallus]